MIIKIFNGSHFIAYLDFKVKYIFVKSVLTLNKLQTSLTSNTVYGRRHSKLFTNCHVSWDSKYLATLQTLIGLKWEEIFVFVFNKYNFI